ncbi:hypothetical protein PCL_00391 [Purpureocillium lilacinum]|uniref:Uncharacterized protein n=1 Tax=Purpureocillium lilacinum TaxID=33203 RepID=A0A2U3E6Z0_PURLI|nr:hypothetical protein PCL_00391 [Purpureocillium lilacinum]
MPKPQVAANAAAGGADLLIASRPREIINHQADLGLDGWLVGPGLLQLLPSLPNGGGEHVLRSAQTQISSRSVIDQQGARDRSLMIASLSPEAQGPREVKLAHGRPAGQPTSWGSLTGGKPIIIVASRIAGHRPHAPRTTHLLRGARPSRRSHGHEPPVRVQPAASRHPGLLLLLPSPTTATCTSAKRLLLRTAFVSPPHVNGGGGGLRRGRLMRWGDLSRKPQRLPGLNERYTPACGWMQGAGSVARAPERPPPLGCDASKAEKHLVTLSLPLRCAHAGRSPEETLPGGLVTADAGATFSRAQWAGEGFIEDGKLKPGTSPSEHQTPGPQSPFSLDSASRHPLPPPPPPTPLLTPPTSPPSS